MSANKSRSPRGAAQGGRSTTAPTPGAGAGEGAASRNTEGNPDAGGGPRDRPLSVTLAAVVAAVEGVALAVWGLSMMLEGVLGEPRSLVAAELGGVTVLVLAALPLLAARGLLRVRRWGRGPVLIVQLLALPVAWTMAQNGGGMIAAGAALGALALAGLITLVHPNTTRALQ